MEYCYVCYGDGEPRTCDNKDHAVTYLCDTCLKLNNPKCMYCTQSMHAEFMALIDRMRENQVEFPPDFRMYYCVDYKDVCCLDKVISVTPYISENIARSQLKETGGMIDNCMINSSRIHESGSDVIDSSVNCGSHQFVVKPDQPHGILIPEYKLYYNSDSDNDSNQA